MTIETGKAVPTIRRGIGAFGGLYHALDREEVERIGSDLFLNRRYIILCGNEFLAAGDVDPIKARILDWYCLVKER